MPFLTENITITTPASTGIQSYNFGFQPKLILMQTGITTTSGTDTNVVINGFGATDGSTSACNCYTGTAGASTYRTRSKYSNEFIHIINTSGGSTHVATVSALTSTGVDLNWTTTSSGSLMILTAIGGDHVTGAKVLDITTSTGNQPITGVGFEPEVFIFSSNGLNTDTTAAAGNINPNLSFCDVNANFGFVSGHCTDNVTTISSARFQGTSPFISGVGAGPSTFWAADLLSLDADGVTLNWTTSVSGRKAFGIFIKGPASTATIVNEATATGNQVLTPFTFQPKFMLQAATLLLAPIARSGFLYLTIGTCVEDLSQGCTSTIINDGGTWNVSNVSKRVIDTSNLVRNIGVSAAGPFGVGAVTALSSTGYTINWSVKDAFARQIQVLALGDNPSPPVSTSNGQFLLLKVGN